LGYEATASLETREIKIDTPVSSCVGKKLNETISLIPIMRAGLGMVEPMLELLPNADVHHIGMYRSKDSLLPIQYYNKLPREGPSDVAYVLDPMIATAGTICAVVNILKKWGCQKIHVVCVLASKAGLEAFQKMHPEVMVTVCAVDAVLSEGGMIMPGLGDAGNRLYKTPTIEQEEDDELTNKRQKK
jgi:uracil phosphoribosyltransferase